MLGFPDKPEAGEEEEEVKQEKGEADFFLLLLLVKTGRRGALPAEERTRSEKPQKAIRGGALSHGGAALLKSAARFRGEGLFMQTSAHSRNLTSLVNKHTPTA